MPMEKRDAKSKAKLFVPNHRERSLLSNQRKLSRELDEVSKLKTELKLLIEDAKKDK